MDLVLDQNDCFKKAVEKWKIIVPAIIHYSESFSGKVGKILKKVRDDNEGEYCVCVRVCASIQWFSFYLDEELCAFIILVKIIGKKEPRTKEDPLLFAFAKCKVAIYMHFVSFGVCSIQNVSKIKSI